MWDLVGACAFFLLIHFGVSGTAVRDALTRRLGERPYRGLFSLASLGGMGWLIFAYHRAPYLATWGERLALRPVAYGLVLIAFLFAGIGLMTPSPTQVGMESRLDPQGVRGITRMTRHPFLWGVALWAVTHLAVNGDVASLLMFGSLLVLALGGTRSIDAKRRRHGGERWQAFSRATSNVPFAAIVSGGNRLAPALAEIGPWRPLVAIALFVLAFYLHGRLGYPLH